tara:strand:- start:1074 stop:1313 length:240 start_codon:yes stop_codon:yes gene_type:complete
MADLNGTTVYSVSVYQSKGGYEPAQNVAFSMPVWENKISEQSGRSGTVSAIFADPRREQLDNGIQIYPRGDGAIKVHID